MSEQKYVKIEESTIYDNYLHDRNIDDSSSLDDFLNEPKEKTDNTLVDDPNEAAFNWRNHWIQMPEFSQEDNPAYKTITIRFRTEEDYEEFSKLIDQKLTFKTKSIWHPQLDKAGNMLTRWIEENDI